ncbi:restriction endonuclease subunit S [Flavimaricola marinus]|uniref:Type I restriction modification DNA specificity domain protein n=1 Tax=Flavimaricola marinus TaxID=1819565 RepID=A0A238LM81_9RHOB|nr:restriction endonuclease subunit S [Flavimaricola marinus]SMY09950.1 Type I restriction modification DNA specificity domain protein [Flavimaricola marinus]
MVEAPLSSLLAHVVDNRGRTCPTAEIGFPLIATNCVKSDNLYPTFEKVRYVDNDTYRDWFRGHPAPGDLIFVLKGSPGEVCLTPDPVPFCIAQDMVALRPDPEMVYPAYLFAALRSGRAKNDILNMHVGTMIPHFKKGDFDRLFIPIPDKEHQRAIGDAYLTISMKIELNRRMNETLEEMARALFRDWFVDFGPTRRQMEGATDPATIMGHAFPPEKAATLAPLFPAKLGDDGLPEGWEMGRLDDWAVSATNTVKPDEVQQDTSYIGLEHMPRRSIALGQWETAAKVTSNKARFEKGQILFGKLRPYFHKVGIAPCDGICSTDIVVADGRQKEFRPFVATLMSTDEFVAYTNQSSTGTKMPRTSWKLMRDYEAPKAPTKLVIAFGDFAQPMHDKIVHSLSENQTLADMRDLLLPKLMSGEIRLKDEEAVAQ